MTLLWMFAVTCVARVALFALSIFTCARDAHTHFCSTTIRGSRYVPEDQRELQSICERVSPRLQHVNAAVVLSAVKVIMKLLAAMADEDYKTALLAKLAPPLVTLLSSEPEIQ